MVKVLSGDLLQSDTQTLVNTVNCVGVMGKGIALDFKKQFPEMFRDYANRCAKGEVTLGRPYLYRTLIGPWILNFPTKDHWRSLAKLSDIIEGLDYLEAHYHSWGITSLAVPPLGCGNGQLEWRVVGPTLYRRLSRFDIPIELYAPAGTPISEMQSSFLADPAQSATLNGSDEWKQIRPSWIALAEIVERISKMPYHWPVGRTVFQKIAYVASEIGLPTGLEFERRSYGPYSVGLKQLQSRLIGNGLLDERNMGKMQRVTTGETFSDARHAYWKSIQEWDPIIDRTVDLFMRIQSASDAEVVTTSMYVARELAADGSLPSESDVCEGVLAWKIRRRPPVNESDVREAVQLLASKDLIQLSPTDQPTMEPLILESA